MSFACLYNSWWPLFSNNCTAEAWRWNVFQTNRLQLALSAGSPAIKTDRGGWEGISWHSKVESSYWQVIHGVWSGDLMGGGCNAGLQTGLNQPQKSQRCSVRHHTCTSYGQEGNDSPTAWWRQMERQEDAVLWQCLWQAVTIRKQGQISAEKVGLRWPSAHRILIGHVELPRIDKVTSKHWIRENHDSCDHNVTVSVMFRDMSHIHCQTRILGQDSDNLTLNL